MQNIRKNHPLASRILAALIMVLLIAWGYWWLTLAVGIIFLFMFDPYYEAVAWGICFDALYSSPREAYIMYRRTCLYPRHRASFFNNFYQKASRILFVICYTYFYHEKIKYSHHKCRSNYIIIIAVWAWAGQGSAPATTAATNAEVIKGLDGNTATTTSVAVVQNATVSSTTSKYQNDELGFTLQYPTAWSVTENPVGPLFTIPLSSRNTSITTLNSASISPRESASSHRSPFKHSEQHVG